MNEAQLIETVSRIDGVLDVQYLHGEASAVKLLDGRTLVALHIYIEADEPEDGQPAGRSRPAIGNGSDARPAFAAARRRRGWGSGGPAHGSHAGGLRS